MFFIYRDDNFNPQGFENLAGREKS